MDHAFYTEGDVLILTAHIELRNEATPTDLLESQGLRVIWQMSTDGEHDWHDIGEGYTYRLVLNKENAEASYRFFAE